MYSAQDQKQKYDQSKSFLKAQYISPLDIDTLRELLKFHEWKYYVQNDPILSDFEYDQLYKKLETLELDHPELITPDSPTQRVASDLNEDFAPVAHTVPMLSLGNSYNAEDLYDFDKQIKKLNLIDADADIEYCVEPKFDGGSIALVYENDFLVRGATRGNGTLGEEMTPNAKSMPSIPLKADFSSLGIVKAELRGEALIRKDNFDAINKERAKNGKTLFANPRNAATGGLRMKDPNETRKRGLEAFIFQLGYAVDANGQDMLPTLKTHDKGIATLGELGFKIPIAERTVVKNIKGAIDFCAAWEAKRDTYNYEIDGMVVKVNSLELQERSGSTQHHPRWAIAYKFKAKQATTKMVNIEYQVGKIGSITPVAKLDPVHIAGVTVSSVSLHNEEFITSKDLRIGDTVVVERAGDVIPYIVKSLEDLRDGTEEPVQFPEVCPINHTQEEIKLVKVESEAAWRCPNCVCGAQDLQKISFHVSKVAMDIDGFGKSYVERFHQENWLNDISDVYNLDYDKIALLEGFGTRSAQKLESAIEKAKNNPIHKLLHSLSIHHLGKKASKLIAQEINHVFDLKNWSEEDFTKIKDIGPVVAKNVIEYFEIPAHIEMLERMESYGVNLSQTKEDKPIEVAEDAPLAGKTILFTGTLQQMGRKQAQALAEKHGAKNISAVSSNLNILVAGEKAGSKLKKATALGTVEIVTEEEFLTLIKE
ncbi:MAG: NAD-dependent DNA ligase LigA [Saprospiraceae bacterium]|nr:NAD-dependent DNA ligase LigA [Saprospiraceae bacterium]